MEFKTGDKVKLVNYNDFWNGAEAVVTVVPPSGKWDDKYPYQLTLLTDTPAGHRKVGDDGGRWSAANLRPLTTEQDKVLAERFPGYMDVFKSELTGVWAVLDGDGTFYRILVDGTVDKH